MAKQIETLHFTRVVFGFASSPFVLNGLLNQHLDNLQSRYLDVQRRICKSLYVSDQISGGPTVETMKRLRSEAAEIFADAKLELHKWHLNEKKRETSCKD